MKSKIVLLTLASAFVFASCAKQQSQEVSTQKVTNAKVNPETIPGEVVLVTQNEEALEALKEQHSVEVVDREDGVFLVKGKNVEGREAQLIEELSATGNHHIVEPNYLYTINQTATKEVRRPAIKRWLELWALKNYGQDAKSGTVGKRGADIQALKAWSVSRGSRDVVVAVIDTGVDYSHPDLIGNMWVNEQEVSKDHAIPGMKGNGIPGKDDDGNGYPDDVYGWNFVSGTALKPYHGQMGHPDPMDDHGHGTHVAGIIGAACQNTDGVCGVNAKVKIMALKFLDSSGSGSSIDHYRALKYAAQAGADVINASYGGGGKSKLIEQKLKEIIDAGTLFIAAAGNSGGNNDFSPHYPSNYELDGVMSVAATDNRDQLADFSNFGYETVDIAAPGVGILSTYPVKVAKNEAKSDKEKLPYRTFSGTSMATPYVVGAAALILAVDPTLKGKPVELKKRLMESVDWMPHLAGQVASSGRLNLFNAVSGIQTTALIDSQGWKEEPFSLSTPANTTAKLDQSWKIHKQGAKAIRVHIKQAIVDQPYDLAMIFDQSFRKILSIPSMVSDFWTPAVVGDTLYFKFSNAMVSVQKFLGEKEVNDPSEIPADQRSICYREMGNPKWICMVYDKPSKPFANFTSDGVIIDKIRYLK